VGRPPQEDSEFGAFIHELTAPLISTVVPGVHSVHAVDAAGVHALLLARRDMCHTVLRVSRGSS
jgi:4-hydroxy-3-polyprenylbenzoate decarboxylase